MADRGNVPDAGTIYSRPETDDDDVVVDATSYPFSAFNPIHFESSSSDDETGDYYNHCQSGLTNMDQPNWVSNCINSIGNDNYEDTSENSAINGENSLNSSENDNEDADFCDFIQDLGLSFDDVDSVQKNDDENNTMFEDVVIGEVASEGCDEDDDTTVQRNAFAYFLERSNSIIRSVMRKVYNISPSTPRE